MFQFTIRELVLVTVIVAVAIGWLLDRRQLTTLRKDRDSWKGCVYALVGELNMQGVKAKVHDDHSVRISGYSGDGDWHWCDVRITPSAPME